MTTEEKLTLLEEVFEAERGTLKADMLLSDVEEWDSMSKLSLIVMMEDTFGKKMTGNDIRNLVSVQDILSLMQ